MTDLEKWGQYHDVIYREFMWCCKGRSVLEIAPFSGHQSQIIDRAAPIKYSMVEPSASTCEILREKFPQYAVHNVDIFEFYKEPHPVDVVVCMGLLYHLHNALHLLELIANQSSPVFILLDSIGDVLTDSIFSTVENSCVLGNRQVPGDRRFIDISISTPYSLVRAGLGQMGYREVSMLPDGTFNIHSKRHTWTALFERQQ